MDISVKLYGALRDKLPREQKGKAVVALSADSTILDLLTQLDVGTMANVSVNDQHNLDLNHILQDGDSLIVFSHAAGG